MKRGSLVRTPAGGIYGGIISIVTEVRATSVTVHTGREALTYERGALVPYGEIVFTAPYATYSGNRFQRFELRRADGSVVRGEIQVREGRDGFSLYASRDEMRRAIFQHQIGRLVAAREGDG